jgi:hypothetical protein
MLIFHESGCIEASKINSLSGAPDDVEYLFTDDNDRYIYYSLSENEYYAIKE